MRIRINAARSPKAEHFLPMRGAILAVVLGLVLAASLARATTPTCGCGLTPPATPGSSTTRNITPSQYPGVRPGSYILYVPAGYEPNTPMPIVIALHERTGTGSGMRSDSGLDRTADRYGFIPAYPDGVDYPEALRGWAFPGCNASPAPGQTDSCGRRIA